MSYGCFNRAPLKTRAKVQDGWWADGTRKMIEIADPMTKTCNYTTTELGKVDPQCNGCKWKHKEAK